MWAYPIWRISRVLEALHTATNFEDVTDIMNARLGALTIAATPDLSRTDDEVRQRRA